MSQDNIPVHMHVMATKVERDKELEQDGIGRIGRREIAQQARCRAP